MSDTHEYYYVAFVIESSGEWDIVAQLYCRNEEEAEAEAEELYPDSDWYVLDKHFRNVNGGY